MKEDMVCLLRHNASRGFPSCLGSIDCWHWAWKNCPTAWQGHYTGIKGRGCVAEAVCSHDLWIWHLFVGNPGSLNDLNILDWSPLLHQLYNGEYPSQLMATTTVIPIGLGTAFIRVWLFLCKHLQNLQLKLTRTF